MRMNETERRNLELHTEYGSFWAFWEEENGERECRQIVSVADGGTCVWITIPTCDLDDVLVKYLLHTFDGDDRIDIGKGTVTRTVKNHPVKHILRAMCQAFMNEELKGE